MSQTSDPDRFFQTTTSVEQIQRKALKSKNDHGNPVKLQSKILAIIKDPANDGTVFVAESAGIVRRVVLETREKIVYKGPSAPLTCLALSWQGDTVFAGCWDKTIWAWNTNTREVRHIYKGHTDFVKTVLHLRLGQQDLLVSGGADACIIVWDLSAGSKLHSLKGHTRGVQDLAVDPTTYLSSSSTVILFSAGSDREIRRWRLSLTSAEQVHASQPIVEHETSVYRLLFDLDDDLWTASADGTVKCLSRERGWKPEMALTHPDFVRDVVLDEKGGWVVTVCRDEEVRVWNRATGQLCHTFSGHYEEITGLVLISQTAVSVSIDASIRQWSLKSDDLRIAILAREKAKNPVAQDDSLPVEKSLMTEEEEQELAELMESNE